MHVVFHRNLQEKRNCARVKDDIKTPPSKAVFLKTAQKDNSEKADFHISFLWPRVYFSSDWVSFGPPGGLGSIRVLSFLWSAILVRTITINRAISVFTKGPCLFVRGYIILSF